MIRKLAALVEPFILALLGTVLLASVLPSPQKWRVDPPGPYVRKRAGTVRARMSQVRRDGLDVCVLKQK